MDELSKLKDIIRANIKNIKEVADNLVYLREKFFAMDEVIEELLGRVESLESKTASTVSSTGVKMFGVGVTASSPTQTVNDLDLSLEDLKELIIQHPSWLRPFSVLAELEKHELEVDTIRLRRSPSGYLRVVRISDGTEWAYFENMSRDRFSRLPLLKEIFVFGSEIGSKVIEDWCTAWVSTPSRLQSLQRGARWEILEPGQLLIES